MSGDYRDELGAAHHRIAELEDKVATLEAEISGAKSAKSRNSGSGDASDDELRRLKDEVETWRAAADVQKAEKTRHLLTIIGVVLCVTAGFCSYARVPVAALACSLFFFIMLVARFTVGAQQKASVGKLKEAEQKLNAARRLRELERRAADVKDDANVRVASDAAADEEEDAEEPEQKQGAAR